MIKDEFLGYIYIGEREKEVRREIIDERRSLEE